MPLLSQVKLLITTSLHSYHSCLLYGKASLLCCLTLLLLNEVLKKIGEHKVRCLRYWRGY